MGEGDDDTTEPCACQRRFHTGPPGPPRRPGSPTPPFGPTFPGGPGGPVSPSPPGGPYSNAMETQYSGTLN